VTRPHGPPTPVRRLSADRRPDRVGLALAAIVIVGAGLRLATIGGQSFWLDEAFTRLVVDRPLPQVLRWIWSTESAPPLYYTLAWAWTRPFGAGDMPLRALSALAGTLTVPVVYVIGRDLLSRRAGLVAALLAAVSPTLVWYSQEARAYGLFVLLSALGFLFFVRARREPSRRNLGAWALFSALALWTHYFALYLVAPMLLLLVLEHRRVRVVRWSTAAVVAAGLVVAPLALHQARSGRSAWIADIDLALRVRAAVLRLLAPAFAPPWAGATGAGSPDSPWWPIGAALLALAAGALLVYGSRPEWRAAALPLALGAFAFGAPLLVAVVTGGRVDGFLDRNLLAAWVPFNAALAVALSAGALVRVGAVVAAAIAIASVVVVGAIATDNALQRDDWRSFVGAVDLSSGAVAVVPGQEVFALRHYARDLADLERPLPVRRISIVVRGPRGEPHLHVPENFSLVEERREQNLRVFRYESSRAVVVAREDVGSRWGPPRVLLADRSLQRPP
jgi:mannosyltransferase